MYVETTLERALDRYSLSNSQTYSPKHVQINNRHPEKRHFLDKDQFINESGLLM